MTVQTINIGTLANDGSGDDLREAFIKTNQNFADLDLRSPENTTVTNLGNVAKVCTIKKLVQNYNLKNLFKALILH